MTHVEKRRPSRYQMMRPLAYRPPNKVFDLIHRIWKSHCRREKIFNIEFSVKDYLLAIERVLRY